MPIVNNSHGWIS